MVSAPWSFTGCDNSDDSSSEGAKSDPAVAEDSTTDADLQYFTAFRVLRALCALPTDADTSAGETSGIELLPEGWQGMKFQSDEGYVLNDENPAVRSVVVASLDDAKEYVSSIIGEDIEGDSFSWSDSALGSLRFKAGSGEDIFATLDVSISQIDNLTQIQFVSSSYFEDSPNSENAFKGVPYYAAGDIIKRKSDNTYWICVRPAGGPWHKDNSYWIELGNEGSDSIDTKINGKKRYYQTSDTLPYDSLLDYSNGKIDEIRSAKVWLTYEQNLMSLKTAKAAAHTFHLIANKDAEPLIERFTNPDRTYSDASELRYGLTGLLACGLDGHLKPVSDVIGFNFAYESPKTDSARSKSHPSGISHKRGEIPSKYKKYYAKYALVNKVQPFIRTVSEVQGEKLVITMATKRKENIVTPDKEIKQGKQRTAEFLYSLTDTHDVGFLYTIQSTVVNHAHDVNWYYASHYDLDSAYDIHFDCFFPSFTFDVGLDVGNRIELGMEPISDDEGWMGIENVILSPELKIEDNKGKNGQAVKPDEGYIDYFRQANICKNIPIDYWGSLDYTTHIINGKTVTNWKTEHD